MKQTIILPNIIKRERRNETDKFEIRLIIQYWINFFFYNQFYLQEPDWINYSNEVSFKVDKSFKCSFLQFNNCIVDFCLEL